MTWLILLYSLELGYLPLGELALYDPGIYYDIKHSLYTTMDAELQGFGFFIGGHIRTTMWHDGTGYTFRPNSAEYLVKMGYRRGNVEIGFRHYCTHPVVVLFGLARRYEAIWEGAYEELYFRIGGAQ
jgi:hypothetical protein